MKTRNKYWSLKPFKMNQERVCPSLEIGHLGIHWKLSKPNELVFLIVWQSQPWRHREDNHDMYVSGTLRSCTNMCVLNKTLPRMISVRTSLMWVANGPGMLRMVENLLFKISNSVNNFHSTEIQNGSTSIWKCCSCYLLDVDQLTFYELNRSHCLRRNGAIWSVHLFVYI